MRHRSWLVLLSHLALLEQMAQDTRIVTGVVIDDALPEPDLVEMIKQFDARQCIAAPDPITKRRKSKGDRRRDRWHLK
jgi:hypothetical protein